MVVAVVVGVAVVVVVAVVDVETICALALCQQESCASKKSHSAIGVLETAILPWGRDWAPSHSSEGGVPQGCSERAFSVGLAVARAPRETVQICRCVHASLSPAAAGCRHCAVLSTAVTPGVTQKRLRHACRCAQPCAAAIFLIGVWL